MSTLDFSMIPKTENSVWGDKEYEYFRKLQNLQAKSVFNIVEFDRTINELKQCVTELLWHVAVEEAQLMQQLRLVKEFFLMGRGDLFLEFIKLTAHILNKTPTSHTSRDINLAFQMALRKMHLNDESAIDSFNFVVPILSSENEDADTDATDLPDNERQDPNGVYLYCFIVFSNIFKDITLNKFFYFRETWMGHDHVEIQSCLAIASVV